MKSGLNFFCLKVQGWGMRPRLGFSFGEGVRLGKPKAKSGGQLKINSARVVTKKGERSIEVVVNAILNWSDTKRLGLFTIKGGDGKKLEGQYRLDVEILAPKRLRLTNVPYDWKLPLNLELHGLRGPSGEVYRKSAPKLMR